MSGTSKTNQKPKAKPEVNGLMVEIVDEAKKLAKNEVTSCYDLIMKTKQLMELEKFHSN